MNPHTTTHFQKDLQPAMWKQELPANTIMDPEDEIAALRKELTAERQLADRLAEILEIADFASCAGEVTRDSAIAAWKEARRVKS